MLEERACAAPSHHFAVPLSSVTDHCDGLAQRSSLCKECYLIRWHCQFNHVTDNCFDLVKLYDSQ